MLKNIKREKNGDITITMAANDPKNLPDSKSGKTKVLSSTNGFINTHIPDVGMTSLNLNLVVKV